MDAFTANPALPARLIVVGPVEEHEATALTRRIERSGAPDRVRHLGFVSPERLTALYRDASALVLPSLYEGFGLLRWRRCWARRWCRATSVRPRGRGDAAVYVHGRSTRRAGARRSAPSATTSLRETLSRRGVERASQFTWSRVGEQFADLLHRVAEHGSLVSAHAAGGGTDLDAWPERDEPGLPAAVSAEAEPAE